MNLEGYAGAGTTAGSITSGATMLTDHAMNSADRAPRRSIRAIDVDCFLRLGFFLDYKNPTYSVALCVGGKDELGNANMEELISIGADKYRRAIGRQFQSGEEHVVPLSGGLDSRGILAGLLEHTEAHRISTYTYGTPGTYDYEIGNSVARAAGTKHLKVPLTHYKYTIDKLLSVARRIDFQTCLFLHPDVEAVDEFCRGRIVWSGAMMDALFGKHVHQRPALDWPEAKRNFIRENMLVQSVELATRPIEELFPFIDCDERVSDGMLLEHVLDLKNRQLKFITPHVLMKGYNFRVLFTDCGLVKFCLGLGEEFLSSQVLYKGMLLKAFPKLFRLRTKTAGGLPLEAGRMYSGLHRVGRALSERLSRYRGHRPAVDPWCNYVDFSSGLREREDLRGVVEACVGDLKRRRIVTSVDFDSLWREHLSGDSDHALALLVLASLELHLKAGLCYVG